MNDIHESILDLAGEGPRVLETLIPHLGGPELDLLRALCRGYRLRATLAAEHLLAAWSRPPHPPAGPQPEPSRASLLDATGLSNLAPTSETATDHQTTGAPTLRSAEALVLSLASLEASLDPFVPWLGAGFHRIPTALAEIAHDRLLSLRDLIGSSPSIARIADLLGRARRTLAPPTRTERSGRDSIVGVTLSGDIADALPSELALLATPETEDLFLARLLERRILSLETDGQLPERDPPRRRGPVKVLLDTSGSLQPTDLELLKAAVLAVLERVLTDNRRAELTLFGGAGASKTLDFKPAQTAPAALFAFLMHAFRGGTDLETPLCEALSDLPREAGLLIATDGIVSLSDKTIARLKSAIGDGLELVTVLVGDAHCPTLTDLSASVVTIESGPSLRATFRRAP